MCNMLFVLGSLKYSLRKILVWINILVSMGSCIQTVWSIPASRNILLGALLPSARSASAMAKLAERRSHSSARRLKKNVAEYRKKLDKLGVLAIWFWIQFLNWIKCSFEPVFNKKITIQINHVEFAVGTVYGDYTTAATAAAATIASARTDPTIHNMHINIWHICILFLALFIQFGWAAVRLWAQTY